MNIFAVEPGPVESAKVLCDQHIRKMPVESAQLLSGALRLHGCNDPGLYKKPHNHPCLTWASETKENFSWLLEHARELCAEYRRRFFKTIASKAVVELAEQHIDLIPEGGLTPMAQAFGQWGCLRGPDRIRAYRRFYCADKINFASWKRAPHRRPVWFTGMWWKL